MGYKQGAVVPKGIWGPLIFISKFMCGNCRVEAWPVRASMPMQCFIHLRVNFEEKKTVPPIEKCLLSQLSAV